MEKFLLNEYDDGSESFDGEKMNEMDDEILKTFEKVMDAVNYKNLMDLTWTSFKKPKKDLIRTWIVDLCRTLVRSRRALRAAAATINTLQSDTIEEQKTVIELQKQVIATNSQCVDKIQEAVKLEMASYIVILLKELWQIVYASESSRSGQKCCDRRRQKQKYNGVWTSGG